MHRSIFLFYSITVISQSLFALTLPRKTMIGGREVDKYLGEMLQITFVHVHVLSNDQQFLSYEQSGFKKKVEKAKNSDLATDHDVATFFFLHET